MTEKVQGTTVKDDDYIRIGRPMTFTWKNKFLEAAATIEKYRLYISWIYNYLCNQYLSPLTL
jgi:hypothetical protein